MTDHLVRQFDSGGDIILQPGEFYFGDQKTRIRTLLGSCVAITMWHPRLRIGGMCHYLLPIHQNKQQATTLDGRYGEDAIALFMLELDKTDSRPADYEVKMFGGGNQFPHHAEVHRISVPDNNIHIGRSLLKQHGFTIKLEHLGGTGHRNVIFDIGSGQVLMQHYAEPLNIQNLTI